MQPFERLRAVARWSDDVDEDVLTESVECLAAFDDDPAGLVVACRRLLSHHAVSGPLWWLCARVVTAIDPAQTAWDSWSDLHADPTGTRLVESLPFPHDDPVAVLGWPSIVSTALEERPDLDVVAVRTPRGAGTLSMRLRRSRRAARVVDEVELLALEPSHLLVEPIATGAGMVLLPPGSEAIVNAAADHGGHVWLVVGVGRALPERLLDAMARAAGDESFERVDADRFERVVGPAGVDGAAVLRRRADCPVAPELLRLGL